jgi:putative nucleotidyltransferase with HDIG domain
VIPVDTKDPFALRWQLNLAPLPTDAEQLLRKLEAPPRLIAHLLLVHDVAMQIAERIRQRWPSLALDAEALCFGAAIHDIGKHWHPEELSEPGSQHETTGPIMLVQHGIAPNLARFARTHATWANENGVLLEDLLVALADSCWRGKRDVSLETAIIEWIVTQTGQVGWEIFIALDEVVAACTEKADERLAWMARFPTE